MNEPVAWLLAGLAGLLLGAVFFGGLWWTVRRSISSSQPALWLLGSGVVRMSIAMAGFYWVGQGHGERLLICLLGFIIARVIVTRLAGPPITLRYAPAEEARYAS